MTPCLRVSLCLLDLTRRPATHLSQLIQHTNERDATNNKSIHVRQLKAGHTISKVCIPTEPTDPLMSPMFQGRLTSISITHPPGQLASFPLDHVPWSPGAIRILMLWERILPMSDVIDVIHLTINTSCDVSALTSHHRRLSCPLRFCRGHL